MNKILISLIKISCVVILIFFNFYNTHAEEEEVTVLRQLEILQKDIKKRGSRPFRAILAPFPSSPHRN